MWGPSSPCNIKTILSIGTKRRKAENENDYFVCWSPLGESPYQPPPRWPRRASLSFSFFHQQTFYCKPLIFFLPKKLAIKNSARLLLCTLLYLVFHWLPCLPIHRQHRLQNPKARWPCFRWKFLLEIKLVNAHILPQKLLFRTSIFLKLPTLCSLFFSATWARCLSEN